MARLISNWLESYLHFTHRTEPPILYNKWVAIGTVAAALRRHVWLEWDTQVYPSMYIVLVGPPAARKGTALRVGKRLLEHLDIPIVLGKITPERFYQAVEEHSSALTMDPAWDYGKPLQSTMAVVSDEFTVFIGHDDEPWVDGLCDLWDCHRHWTYQTKGAGTNHLHNLAITIMGATTPEAIRTSFPQRAIGGGLTSRTIFVWGDRKSKIVTCPTPTDVEMQLGRKLFSDLKQMNELRGPFRITQEWQKLYERWYIASETNPPILDPKFAHYLGRRQVHMLKLCMVLSAMRDNDMVLDAEIFLQAEELLNETEAEMPNVFTGMGRTPTAQIMPRIMDYIRRRKGLSVQELLGQFGEDINYSELNEVLGKFQAVHAIRIRVMTPNSPPWVEYTPDEYAKYRKQRTA